MSPTVFRDKGFRFFFFLWEAARLHIHVQTGDWEAKSWIEPQIELAGNYGLKGSDLAIIEELIEEHESEIRAAWHRHFGS